MTKMTTGSRNRRRWVLGIAAGTAFLGLILKLTDLRGLVHGSSRKATASAPATRGGGVPAPSAPGDHTGDLASITPGGGSEAAERLLASGTGSSRPYDSTELGAGFVSSGGRRALERAQRHEARARRRAERAGGSLTTGGVGDGAAGGLGGSGSSAHGGHTVAAGGSTATPAQPANAAAATDVAFQSGDTQYQTGTQAQIPDIGKLAGAGVGTLSFWMQPSWGEGNQDDASLLTLGDGRLQVIKNVGFLRFEFVDDAGNPAGLGAPIAEWKEGEWHQVSATWNGNTYSLYVDGQLVSQTVHDGRVNLPADANLYIGSNYPDGRPVAPGTIGRVDVRNRPLGPGEVAGNYNAATGRTTARATTGR
jgi:hypothetical protein